MQVETADAIETAIAWQLRLAEANEAVWESFIAWLEESPAHADAYDRVAAADRLIGTVRFPEPAPLVGNDNLPAHRRWYWWAGGAAAAAAVAMAVLPSTLPHAQPYQVATRDGERQTIALDDGTRIELSGGTRMTLDRANPRVARLDQGEALFHVRHDAATPFTLKVGGVAVQDLGTVFNVAHLDGHLNVAVSEGSVAFQPRGAAVTLRPGDALSAQDDGSAVTRTRVAPALVGGWRSGRLSFTGQPLGEVAGSLKRLYGTRIALQGSLSERPFTGVVHFTGAADHDVPRLAELIGATWRRDGGQWILAEQGPNTP
ncbi:FecR family protein [Sphingomonas azotifigens]|uniref:FecR family protein n=1 Tax=Sphingomonas azotifigens TaxID=330920 RepID=UPI0009FBB53D|nr:FecR domain-containing protein [Sphingomonas azotifigens]